MVRQTTTTTTLFYNVNNFIFTPLTCLLFLSCLSLVNSNAIDVLSLTSQNVSKKVDVDVGNARLYTTTLVVNSSTVISIVTFVIGSLLIVLPLLFVIALKLENFDDVFGVGYKDVSGVGYKHVSGVGYKDVFNVGFKDVFNVGLKDVFNVGSMMTYASGSVADGWHQFGDRQRKKQKSKSIKSTLLAAAADDDYELPGRKSKKNVF